MTNLLRRKKRNLEGDEKKEKIRFHKDNLRHHPRFPLNGLSNNRFFHRLSRPGVNSLLAHCLSLLLFYLFVFSFLQWAHEPGRYRESIKGLVRTTVRSYLLSNQIWSGTTFPWVPTPPPPVPILRFPSFFFGGGGIWLTVFFLHLFSS